MLTAKAPGSPEKKRRRRDRGGEGDEEEEEGVFPGYFSSAGRHPFPHETNEEEEDDEDDKVRQKAGACSSLSLSFSERGVFFVFFFLSFFPADLPIYVSLFFLSFFSLCVFSLEATGGSRDCFRCKLR